MSTTVYAVTTGSYSDHSVGPIFTKHDDAERYKAEIGGDDIEEFELSSRLPAKTRTLYTTYGGITPTGVVEQWAPYPNTQGNYGEKKVFPGVDGAPPDNRRPRVEIEQFPAVARQNYRFAVRVTVTGYDLGMLLQAFSDTIAAKVAELELEAGQ